ncbi:MAG: aminotransferase class V-fold PLP-dependent enzyme [bacterium]|nr:aminotransferase class V-fold PLP-dependent enzyme [bacterium]
MDSRFEFLFNYSFEEKALPRRGFFKGLLGGTAAVMGLSHIKCSEDDPLKSLSERSGLGLVDDEKLWEQVRQNFQVSGNLVMVNAANLCPSPYPVQKAVFDMTRDLDSDPSFPNRSKYNTYREDSRKAVAEYLGADDDEIALTRNTSEGNNFVINGIEFNRGDEVIIWDQNHPTANVAWDVRAERYGFRVIRVSTPKNPSGKEELISTFTDAFTTRTKAVAFSHVSNVSGIALPAKEICSIARNNNILTLVDGAQTFGIEVVDLHDIGCDFYTGSSHKWFCGPKEMGVLYVRRECCDMLYPSVVGVGWEGAVNNGAMKFETLGQRDDSRIAAMKHAVDFHNSIGKTRIERRTRELAGLVKSELKRKLPGVKFHTPESEDLSSGVVIFTHDNIDQSDAMLRLYRDYRIGCAVMGGEFAGIRFSPHIYNTEEQIGRAVDAAVALAAR